MNSFYKTGDKCRYCQVSVVGSGMINNPGVAAKLFEALYDAHININMISTSEIKISVLVDQEGCRTGQFRQFMISFLHSKLKESRQNR